MLTVKQVRPDGSEFIEEASSAGLSTPAQSSSGLQSVYYFTAEKEPRCVDIYEGVVYVMNSNGKTVSNYDLGSRPIAE